MAMSHALAASKATTSMGNTNAVFRAYLAIVFIEISPELRRTDPKLGSTRFYGVLHGSTGFGSWVLRGSRFFRVLGSSGFLRVLEPKNLAEPKMKLVEPSRTQ